LKIGHTHQELERSKNDFFISGFPCQIPKWVEIPEPGTFFEHVWFLCKTAQLVQIGTSTENQPNISGFLGIHPTGFEPQVLLAYLNGSVHRTFHLNPSF
jgi:hypothetical protein